MFFVVSKELALPVVVKVVLFELLLFLLQFILENGLLINLGLVLRFCKRDLLFVDVLLKDESFSCLSLES